MALNRLPKAIQFPEGDAFIDERVGVFRGQRDGLVAGRDRLIVHLQVEQGDSFINPDRRKVGLSFLSPCHNIRWLLCSGSCSIRMKLLLNQARVKSG